MATTRVPPRGRGRGDDEDGRRRGSDLARVTTLRSRRGTTATPADYHDDAPKARRTVGAPPGRRSRSYVALLALVLALVLIGLAMVLSASSVTSAERTGSPWSQFSRQAMWCAGGIAALVVVLRVDYRRWRRYGALMVVASALMLLAVLIPGVGMEVNGATRWLGYGSFSIQPSEIAKLALIVFFADLLARRAKWMDDPRLTLVPVLVVFGVFAALIMAQPNLGTTVIIFATVFAMLFVAGTPGKYLGGLAAGAIGLGGAALLLSPWRFQRLLAFRDPWQDPQGTGYQTIQSLGALANGGVTGTGLGQGRSKWGFLPEAHTDFIFAVIAEETGMMGAMVVIGLFIAFGVFGIRVALRAPDRFGMLLATGITAWFLVQAFLNIGQAVGALPVMGVPLPFVSSGGSSLLVSMAAAGMLLNVARHTD